jgi:class 3 adenylate cyclase
MSDIDLYIEELRKKSEERFDGFKIESITSIKQIQEDAYLEKPIWLGGDQKFVCLFIDLDKSSKISFKKHPQTMAKIYDYFTQNIVDIFNHPVFGADYIDIKGDGAFGIFEGDKASFKALYCAITFKTLFEKYIKDKFDIGEDHLSCKFGIHKDKILVRKIGKRGKGNYNEVWAGRLVNNAAKLANESKNVPVDVTNPTLPILVSKEVYVDFHANRRFGFHHCCDGRGGATPSNIEMFTESANFSDEILGDKFYYTRVCWCKDHADDYVGLI